MSLKALFVTIKMMIKPILTASIITIGFWLIHLFFGKHAKIIILIPIVWLFVSIYKENKRLLKLEQEVNNYLDEKEGR